MVKPEKYGFTTIELLTVIAIIGMLVAILVPAMNMVRNTAKRTQQKAQLTSIDVALMTFKSDYGNYPPSDWKAGSGYCGAQKLCEALLGWDLLGFHPDSEWTSNGFDASGTVDIYGSTLPGGPTDDNLNKRRGPYLELSKANAFKISALFNDTRPLAGNTYTLCDVFGVKKVRIGDKAVKAGSPILYYRADTSKKQIETGRTNERIYNARDNVPLTTIIPRTENGKPDALGVEGAARDYQFFYEYITDPKVEVRAWPYRADSYILISAGADGEYGTNDDVTNFGN